LNSVVPLLRRLWRKRRLRRKPAAPDAPRFVDGETFFHLGEAVALRVTQDEAVALGCLREGDALRVNLAAALSAQNLREEARLELLLWYKREARRDFRERLAVWAARLDVGHGRMIVTSPRRRWGSCNYRNDIRLNWRLMLLPPTLIDYVVAHELCHVRHKHHGKSFWAELAGVMPDWKTRRQCLRQWEGRHW